MNARELLFILPSLCVGGVVGVAITDTENVMVVEEQQTDVTPYKSKIDELQKVLSETQDKKQTLELELMAAQSELEEWATKYEALLKEKKTLEKPQLEKAALAMVEKVEAPKNELEATPEQEQPETPKTLAASMKMFGQMDASRVSRHVSRLMDDKLEGLELEEEQEQQVSTLLTTYYEKQNELRYMIMDPNVPAEEILYQLQEIHNQTMTELNNHVQYDVAESLIASSMSERKSRIMDQFQEKYRNLKLDEGSQESLLSKVDSYYEDNPALAFSMRQRGGATNYPLDLTAEDIQNQRDFIGDTTSLSGLMAKSIETRKQAQLDIFEDMNLQLNEEQTQDFMASLEREAQRSQRGVQFFQRMEEQPDMAEAWMKVSSGMRDLGSGPAGGRSRGGRP